MCYGFKGEVQSPGIYAQALHYVLWDGGLRFRRPIVKHPSQGPWRLAPSLWAGIQQGEGVKKRERVVHPLTRHSERYWRRRGRKTRAQGKTDDLSASDNARPELHFPKTYWGWNGPNIRLAKFVYPSCFRLGDVSKKHSNFMCSDSDEFWYYRIDLPSICSDITLIFHGQSNIHIIISKLSRVPFVFCLSAQII